MPFWWPKRFSIEWRSEFVPLLCLLAGLVVWLRLALFFLGYQFPVSYGEGPILDQALRLSEMKQIYGPISGVPPWTVSNYPPVYQLIQVPLLKIFGAHFWIPRVISVFASLAAACLVGLLAGRVSGSRTAGLWASALFMLSPVNMYWGYLGRVDATAVAFALAGVYLAHDSGKNRFGLVPSGLLFLMAVFTRQTAIIWGPGLAITWLLSEKRLRDSFRFGALFAAAVLAVFFFLNYLTGGGFYHHIVEANINEFDFKRIGISAELLLFTWPVSFAAFLWLLFSGKTNGKEKIWLSSFALLSVLVSSLIAKKGSDINYFYEISIFLSVSGGYFFAKIPLSGRQRRAAAMLLAMQAALLLWHGSALFWPQYQGALKREKQLENLLSRTRGAGGAVLADQFIGLEVISGQSVYYQPFEMMELMKRGLWNDEPLLTAIRQKKFSLISIYLPYREQRWSSRQQEVINENYSPDDCSMKLCVYSPKSDLH